MQRNGLMTLKRILATTLLSLTTGGVLAAQSGAFGLRIIRVRSESEATAIQQQLQTGAKFEMSAMNSRMGCQLLVRRSSLPIGKYLLSLVRRLRSKNFDFLVFWTKRISLKPVTCGIGLSVDERALSPRQRQPLFRQSTEQRLARPKAGQRWLQDC